GQRAKALLTPIGNPQNILLWGRSGLSFTAFTGQMAPLALAIPQRPQVFLGAVYRDGNTAGPVDAQGGRGSHLAGADSAKRSGVADATGCRAGE
ncbi:hypothetical protein ABKW03_23145, partial [Enterobacter hormaechei]